MKRYLLLFLIFAANTARGAEILMPSEIKNQIVLSCQKEIPVTIIFMTDKESNDQAMQEDNELYADWAYYLNDGIPLISDRMTIIKTTVNAGRKLLKSKKTPKDMYSLVFVPCKKKALYSEGAILESYVYKYIKFYFENKEEGLMLSDLLSIDSSTFKDETVTPNRLGLGIIDASI